MYGRYVRLDGSDADETLALAFRQPEFNLILINNIRMFGMDRGETPFHGEYFGLRELLSWQVRKGAASVAEREGLVVSKAEATVVKGAGANVGGVYTRPAFRGRGLSTACVGDLCKRVLNEVDLVALNVEKENLASRRVYQKIGFGKIDDWMIATPRPRT